MKRSTPEERRWENGLRQSARTSAVYGSMRSPTVRRSSGLRRPTTETKKIDGNSVTSTPLVATAALEAYLSNDVDATTRIPRPRPGPGVAGLGVTGPVEKKVSRPVAALADRRLNNASTIDVKRQESENQTRLRVPVDPKVAAATRNEEVASRAESPLSRFQKHIKQTQSIPNRGTIREFPATIPQWSHTYISTARTPAAGSSQSLTRSLMDKIKEAKGLRQAEAASRNLIKYRHNSRAQGPGLQSSVDHIFLPGSFANSLYPANFQPNVKAFSTVLSTPVQKRPSVAQSAATVTLPALKTSPPIPHAKPIMPPLLQSSQKMTMETQHGEDLDERPPHGSKPRGTASSINNVIVATNAVVSIQRMWRRKRLLVRSRRRNKERDDEPGTYRSEPTQVTLVVDKSVTPLYTAAKRRDQQVTEEQQPKNEEISKLDNECDVAHDAGTRFPGGTAALHPSFQPWTDHELVFLEEGRCIGELHESVRRGVFMDQDELVWKRPQHVIQQLETQRVAKILKTQRKCAPGQQAQDHLILTVDHKVDVPDSNINDANETTISPIQTPSQVMFPSSTCRLDQVVSPTIDTRSTGVATMQRKRKLPRVQLQYRKTNRKSTRTRGLLVRLKESRRDNGHAVPNCTAGKEETRRDAASEASQTQCRKNSAQQSGSSSSDFGETEQQRDQTLHLKAYINLDMRDRFVVFSDSEQTSNEMDTKLSRNDLISMGDLALARSLLYDKLHCHANDVVAHHDGFIPLTVPTPSFHAAQSSIQSKRRLDEPVSSTGEVPATTACDGGRYGEQHGVGDHAGSRAGSDHGAVGNPALKVNWSFSDAQRFSQDDEELESLTHHQLSWPWENLLAQMEGSRARSDDGDDSALLASFASLPSSGNNALVDSRVVNVDQTTDAVPQQCSRSTTNPMRALNIVKSAVAETMARIHTQHRDEAPQPEHATPSNQPPEEPSPLFPVPAIPVAKAIRPRLDEDKRIEFLRVLDDFKRCLQQSSTPSWYSSSTNSLQISPRPTTLSRKHEAVETKTLPSELSNQETT